LPGFVKRDAGKKRNPFVVVFVLHDADTLINDRGTAFANEALAKLFQTMREQFPGDAVVSQLKTTEFALYLPEYESKTLVENIQRTIDIASQRCNKLATFSAGYFSTGLVEKKRSDSDKSTLAAEHSLDYARYAALSASNKPGSSVLFSPAVAASVLYESRKRHFYLQAAKDYTTLVEIGINNHSVENQAGLCAFEMEPRDSKSAIKAFIRATTLLPTDSISWRNLCMTLLDVGDAEGATSAFKKVFELEDELQKLPAYSAAMAMCAYELYNSDDSVITANVVLSLMRQGLEDIAKSAITVDEAKMRAGIQAIEITLRPRL
jgi:GGDEF domain-containing protein